MPPPYTLPAHTTPPPAGLYPTLQVTGGHVSVCDLPPAPLTDPLADRVLRDKLQAASGPIRCSTPYTSHSTSTTYYSTESVTN
ncbi:hypothetical protein XENOCAPTIV_024557 [Xenoophorus captivus]|uniref:Uncharacterized protein n=1 Tax=Xenoophorus captivus TaxID=1517983 RepID=A0ABV0RLT0_9TELE